MTTAIIQKNYKKLEERLGHLERVVEAVLKDELSIEEVQKLEKISQKLDRGAGKYFVSRSKLLRYLKSL